MRLGKPKLWSGPSADGIGDLHAVVFCTQFALRCCFSSSAGWNAFRLDSVFVAMILREGGYGPILSKMKLLSSYLAEIGLTQTLGCPSADLEVTTQLAIWFFSNSADWKELRVWFSPCCNDSGLSGGYGQFAPNWGQDHPDAELWVFSRPWVVCMLVFIIEILCFSVVRENCLLRRD